MGPSSRAATVPPQVSKTAIEVVVLIDEDTFAPETTEIENIPTRTYENSPVGFALQAKFGNPIAVKLLVAQGAGRLSTYARRSLPKDSSSALLDSYLTLSFANEIAAQNAVQRLRGLVGVRWAGVLLAQKFSQATTTDPLFTGAVGSSPFAQQWGLNAVNANSAWSLIDGIAYVGVNDNGIQASHEDFADFSYGSAFKPQFSTNVVAGYTADVDERALSENYAGHGTHVSSIIAARHNGIGGAGICKGCSLMTTKIAQNTQLSPSAAAAGLSWLTRAGAQVINISFGGQSSAPYADLCTSQPYDPYCVAIRQAVDYRVTVVAAAGNHKAQYMNFPALDSRVLSVGGLQKNEGGGYEAWNQSIAFNYPPTSPSRSTSTVTETGTDGGTTAQIFAPARDIVSAMYAGYDWNPDYRCGTSRYMSPITPNLYSPPLAGNQTDGFIGSGSGSFGNRYGICTGTSMAAPHVTGVVALIRSANPLLSSSSVKSLLQQTAATTGQGLPYPNALAAVQSALNTNGRLTPLFIFFSADYADYFQTIVPQMGASALMQGVLPATLSGARVTYGTFSSIGNPVTGFTSFLDGTIPVPKGYSVDNLVPRARVRVFTTPRDAQGTTLTPLFRASFVNNAPGATTFLLRHYIAAGQAERDALSTSIWKIDGIEGYVYPASSEQPSGTSRIVRAHNPSTLNWVIVPEIDLALWQTYGFTAAAVFVGYAYLN